MSPKGLKKLEIQLHEELDDLGFPPDPWILKSRALPHTDYDVVIVGAGMAGLAAAFGLLRQGITNIVVYDLGKAGVEGPWATYARMLTLRSGKKLAGPALDIPSLTFQAWFEAQFGVHEWEKLYKIPTPQWMEYLRWYRHVLHIPVENNTKVLLIKPQGPNIKLELEQSGKNKIVTARKVILATGRGGWGQWITPEFIRSLPVEFYAHTCDPIDFDQLQNKDVIIVGVGASAFDSAAAALERGVKTVKLITRRKHIGHINKFKSLTYPGFALGYVNLADDAKIKFMEHCLEEGAVPPFESLRRIEQYKNLEVLTGINILEVKAHKKSLEIHTSKEKLTGDFLILATGFEVDGSKQPELKEIYPDILLWNDRHPNLTQRLGRFPYLGNHFQFLGKTAHRTTYLQNIYCYNFAAFLSHGLVSGDIPNISIGAKRLAEGIASDFFTQDWVSYYKRLTQFDEPEFKEDEYSYIKHP